MLRWMVFVILGITVAAIGGPRLTLEDDPTARYTSRIMPNLEATEKVVWVDGAPPGDAAALYPNDRVVTVQQTITGIGCESPSAVIFGPGRTSDGSKLVGEFLANGTRVVLQSDTKPEGPWTWERSPIGWTTTHAIAGPPLFLSPAVYDAIDLRPTGRPAELRRRVVLLVGLFALAALAASLLRRWAVWGVIAVSAVATVGLFKWSTANATVVRQGVTVMMTTGGVQQVDRWTFDRAPGPLRLEADPALLGWPVLRSVEHERATELEVSDTAVGYEIAPATPMVLLRRSLRAATEPPVTLATIPPQWRRLVALYITQGTAITGMEDAGDSAKGPTLWLTRDTAATP